MKEIDRYFPDLTAEQRDRFSSMAEIYGEWNAKINVISRKDMENFYLHHVLHSLSIAKVVRFNAGEKILDVGTGGGFPGIPLAVMFPENDFTLCDSIGKKIKVAEAAASELGLKNVHCVNCRAESLDGHYDYVVSRAVTSLGDFMPWMKGKYDRSVIYLKGGDLKEELAECSKKNKIAMEKICTFEISTFFAEDYFKEKKIVIILR